MFCLNARLREKNNFTHMNYKFVNVQKMHFEEDFILIRYEIPNFCETVMSNVTSCFRM